MERLQAAIEKARAQRNGSAAAPKRTKSDPAATPATLMRRTVARPEGGAPDALTELWRALPQLKIDSQSLHRGRVATAQGGTDAAPFDLLRTRMLQQARQNGWHRVALVSPHAGCGKTTTAANLAFSLSRQSDLRAMIFDFDLRRRGLTQLFRPQVNHTMADVLEGRLPFSDHGMRHGENIAFGFNGQSVHSASEVLQSAHTVDKLTEIEELYQPSIMIFDMPPLMASDDNFGFLQNVDAAILLVAAEKTSMSQVDVAERQLAELTNVMGVVLNKCRYTDGAYGHSYDYY